MNMSYQWAVRLRIALNVIAAIFMLWMPKEFIELLRFRVEPPLEWVQAFAILVIFVTFAYVPSAIAALRARAANAFVIAAPIIPVILLFWLGGSAWWEGFFWIALYELAFALLLGMTFQNDWIADLMSKP
ncbi:MAG: hypothetical protein ACR2OV_15620 [Hyphomicrobiaceae bacterium]